MRYIINVQTVCNNVEFCKNGLEPCVSQCNKQNTCLLHTVLKHSGESVFGCNNVKQTLNLSIFDSAYLPPLDVNCALLLCICLCCPLLMVVGALTLRFCCELFFRGTLINRNQYAHSGLCKYKKDKTLTLDNLHFQ